MKNKIIEALIGRGYEAELETVTKNNVKMDAIVMGTGTIRPTIYIDNIINECIDIDRAVDKIIEIYESNKNPNIDVNSIFNRDFILNHISIAIQKDTEEDIVKKPTEFEGIEQYLLILDGGYSVKVTVNVLNAVGIDVIDAWSIAMNNLKSMTVFKPMAELLGMSEPIFDDFPMTVISNTYSNKGASAILNKEALKEYARKHNTDKIFFVPSSVHEGIIITGDYGNSIDRLTEMVKEVNAAEVDVVDQLADRVYVISI